MIGRMWTEYYLQVTTILGSKQMFKINNSKQNSGQLFRFYQNYIVCATHHSMETTAKSQLYKFLQISLLFFEKLSWERGYSHWL